MGPRICLPMAPPCWPAIPGQRCLATPSRLEGRSPARWCMSRAAAMRQGDLVRRKDVLVRARPVCQQRAGGLRLCPARSPSGSRQQRVPVPAGHGLQLGNVRQRGRQRLRGRYRHLDFSVPLGGVAKLHFGAFGGSISGRGTSAKDGAVLPFVPPSSCRSPCLKKIGKFKISVVERLSTAPGAREL